MGRIKRGYTRVIPPDELKRDYRLFAIACEGHREKEYLEQFEGISRRVIVEYIKDEDYPEDPPSAPAHVLRRAIKYVESNALNDEDSIWLVMDVDKWGDKILNEIHDYCQQQSNWRIIISNPCFEIWLLYHTRVNLEGIDFNTAQKCKTLLNDETPGGYNPKSYVLLVKNAMNNAKNADKFKSWYPIIGNTTMYELIESLMQFVSVKEFEEFISKRLY